MSVRTVSPSYADDEALARACVAGDVEAFAQLYRRYFPDLVRFLERRGNDHGRAEDIAQETLARAFRYLSGFDASRPVWPWLRTIAMRVAGNDATVRTSEVLVYDAPDGVDPVDPVDALAARSVLVESLRRLPDRQRDALVMRYVEDLQPADIAAVLGMTRNSLEQLLWRARRGLAREYGRLTGAVLVPLSLRLRRAAHWLDTRASAAWSGVVAGAGDVAVGAVVVVASATAAVTAAPGAKPVPATTTATVAAVPVAAPLAPSRPASGVRTSPGAPAARPAAPAPAQSSDDVVVERNTEVGPAAARSRNRVSPDPTREGSVQEDENDVRTRLVETHGGGGTHNSGGPSLACLLANVCDVTPGS
jgi:RNA polymerase sigma-70 factor (ECF subfamily)